MSYFKFLGALVVTGLLATSAIAQQAQPAQPDPAAKPANAAWLPAAATSAPALPTRQGDPTAAQVALAREVMINSGIAMSIANAIPQLQEQMYNNILKTRPDLVKDLNTTMARLEPEFTGYIDQVVNTVARFYLNQISDADLGAINNFYKGDAGKAFVRGQPAILMSMSAAMEAWTQKVSMDMVKRTREELKKLGHDF